MPNPISVVTGDYPHTAKLKSMPGFAGAAAEFPRITPVHDAFDDMVRTQKYDVCEMAIGALDRKSTRLNSSHSSPSRMPSSA